MSQVIADRGRARVFHALLAWGAGGDAGGKEVPPLGLSRGRAC